jgi:putative membrane protein
MIHGYSDLAANERTFLASVRTGIAVLGFGFVVEKFNLSVLAMATTSAPDAGPGVQLGRLLGPLGRYDGRALIAVGMAVIAISAMRFVRIQRLLDDQANHSAGGPSGPAPSPTSATAKNMWRSHPAPCRRSSAARAFRSSLFSLCLDARRCRQAVQLGPKPATIANRLARRPRPCRRSREGTGSDPTARPRWRSTGTPPPQSPGFDHKTVT